MDLYQLVTRYSVFYYWMNSERYIFLFQNCSFSIPNLIKIVILLNFICVSIFNSFSDVPVVFKGKIKELFQKNLFAASNNNIINNNNKVFYSVYERNILLQSYKIHLRVSTKIYCIIHYSHVIDMQI